jgi:hypothetical protein
VARKSEVTSTERKFYENKTKLDSNLAAVCGGAVSGNQRSATRDEGYRRKLCKTGNSVNSTNNNTKFNMKKLILSASMVIGLSVAATYGQGYIFIFNGPNQDESYSQTYSSTVTSGGLVFTTTTANQPGAVDPTDFPGSSSQLECVDFNLVVLGGPTASSANQLMGVWLLSGYGQSLSAYAAANGYTLTTQTEPYTTVQNAYGICEDAGVFQDPGCLQFGIPGVTTSPGYLDFFMWEGTASSYDAAIGDGDARGTTGVFAQACTTGTVVGLFTTDLPDVLLEVPEPGALVLAGLGGLSLLLFRRRK